MLSSSPRRSTSIWPRLIQAPAWPRIELKHSAGSSKRLFGTIEICQHAAAVVKRFHVIGFERQRTIEARGIACACSPAAVQHIASFSPAIDARRVFFQDTLNVSQRVGKTPLLDTDGRPIDQRLRLIRPSKRARAQC